MCDPSGMSVVAPSPALPSVTGELTAQKSCESPLQDEMHAGRSRDDKPLPRVAPEAPDRIAVTLPSLPRMAGSEVEGPEATLPPRAPGYARDVYRPPRVR